MSKIQLTYLVAFIAVATFITSYESVHAAIGGEGAQASVMVEQDLGGPPPQSQESAAEQMQFMRQTVLEAVSAQPELYNQNLVAEFMNDPTGWSLLRHMSQRSFNWRRAAQLAIKNLRWKSVMGVGELNGSMFPCDIFKLGLIMEHGVSNQLVDGNGSPSGGSPVIWIRLGALGNVVKHMEKLTAKRLVSFAYNSIRKVGQESKGFFRKHFLGIPNQPQQQQSERAPLVENMSMKNDQTVQYVLKAITWWLTDWERRHAPGTKATLVLDFENTDFAFSSWSMGEFFISLDDHFPDLFDQILGFRYKAKLWSLHSPISMFNRIFKSRLSSSPETDSKLKFVKDEPKLSAYITRVDVQGFSMLPEYIYGDCYGPVNQAPNTCQANNNVLLANQMYDPNLLQAIENEFYQVCKPRNH